eukprot:jgi/Psemu1/19203/gm1.19203_g
MQKLSTNGYTMKDGDPSINGSLNLDVYVDAARNAFACGLGADEGTNLDTLPQPPWRLRTRLCLSMTLRAATLFILEWLKSVTNGLNYNNQKNIPFKAMAHEGSHRALMQANIELDSPNLTARTSHPIHCSPTAITTSYYFSQLACPSQITAIFFAQHIVPPAKGCLNFSQSINLTRLNIMISNLIHLQCKYMPSGCLIYTLTWMVRNVNDPDLFICFANPETRFENALVGIAQLSFNLPLLAHAFDLRFLPYDLKTTEAQDDAEKALKILLLSSGLTMERERLLPGWGCKRKAADLLWKYISHCVGGSSTANTVPAARVTILADEFIQETFRAHRVLSRFLHHHLQDWAVMKEVYDVTINKENFGLV